MTMFIASSKLFSIKIFISLSCTKNQWVFFSKHSTAIIKYFLVSEGKNTGFFCCCFKSNRYILWCFSSLNSFTSVIKIIGISYFPIDIDVRSFVKFDLKKKEDQDIQKLIVYQITFEIFSATSASNGSLIE